jgi:uncharacterized protein (TIRG00374 family)
LEAFAPPVGIAWRRTALRLGVGALVAGVALWVLYNEAGGFASAMEALGDTDFRWLIPALLSEVVCYGLISVELRVLTRGAVSPWVAFRLALVSSGLGSVLPGSPAPGVALSTRELQRRGVRAGRATLTLAWMTWYSGRALMVITVYAVLRATTAGELFRRHPARGVVSSAIVIVALMVTAAIVSNRRTAEWTAIIVSRFKLVGHRPSIREARATGARLHREAMDIVGTGRRRVLVAVLSAASWLADCYCLWFALRSVGVHVSFDLVLLAYCGGFIVSALPLLPGGLGLVEAAVPTILHHFKAPLDVALAGTLAWRGLGLFLPAIAGVGALVSLRSGAVKEAEAKVPVTTG